MERGYIKIYRKILDSGIIQNPHALQLFCYILLASAYKPVSQDVRGEMIRLEPGQLVYGRKSVADKLNMSEKSIRTALKYLEKNEIVAIRATKRYSIISVINWNTYQAANDNVGQQNGHEGAMRGPSEGHEGAMRGPLLKNIKNLRIKEIKNLNTNSSEQTSCSELLLFPENENSPPDIFIDIPLNDGTSYQVKMESVELWQQLFPACDVKQELRSMKAWSLSSMKKRKTRRGVERFIVGWLDRKQNNPGQKERDSCASDANLKQPKTFQQIDEEREQARKERLRQTLKAMQEEAEKNAEL